MMDTPYSQLTSMDSSRHAELGKDAPSLFLNEPDENGRRRRIDYILVIQKKEHEEEHHKKFRETFLMNIAKKSCGLVIEQEERSELTFLKVHAPYEVLYKNAEMLQMRMPLEINNLKLNSGNNMKAKFFSAVTRVFQPVLFPEDDDDNKELCVQNPYNYFTAPFTVARKDQFAISKKMNEESFFSVSDRNRIVYTILNKTIYEPSEHPGMMPKTGIDKLVAEGGFMAAYPLHDGTHLWDSHSNGGPWYANIEKLNDLQKLYYTWASPKAFYKYQPMDPIRRYFGEKIAMYFAWLGFYTQFLIPAAIVGLICFFYGLFTMGDDKIADEVCSGEASKYVMCPRCDKICDFWQLGVACTNVTVSHLFDNISTVFFAVFMAIWGTLFLEFWKRKQNTIDYEWDLFGFEEEQDSIRPQYEALAMKYKDDNQKSWWRENPVTEVIEPFMPFSFRLPRLLLSLGTVLFMICVVLAAVTAVILYRVTIIGVYVALFGDKSASMVTSGTAAVLNLVGITILSKIYQNLATWLTEFESPRTETQYEDSYTMKMFVFQFVNYYASIFYVAFIKGRFTGYPGHYARIFNVRQEECQPGGCLMELTMQLGIIMVGKQFFDNFKELMIPMLSKLWFSRKIKDDETDEEKETKVLARYEADLILNAQPAQNLFYEYLEMVIQFGFITLFVAAFPLAPFFALLNNIIEIRLDAYKFVTQLRRPWAQKSQDIGSWYSILEAIAVLAVITNAFILCVTSQFITKYTFEIAKAIEAPTATNYWNFIYSEASISNFKDDNNTLCPDGSESWCPPQNGLCRYEDFRNPPDSKHPYEHSPVFWYVMTARFAFIILFEHFVFGMKFLLSYLVPDFPENIRVEKLRSEHLARSMLYETDKNPDLINTIIQEI